MKVTDIETVSMPEQGRRLALISITAYAAQWEEVYRADNQANALCLTFAVEEADNAIAQRSTVKLFMNYVRLLKVCIGKSAASF